jgi:Protein of unknown function (DUF3040)
VPLSEHEQRQLEQIEQALYADHPRLARAMRSKDPKVHYRRRVVQAGIGFLAGIGLVAAGLVIKHDYYSVGGVALMLLSALWAVRSYRKMTGVVIGRTRPTAARPARRGPRPQNTGMMDRIEERWRRRQERDR